MRRGRGGEEGERTGGGERRRPLRQRRPFANRGEKAARVAGREMEEGDVRG